jgi:hypothetical protein
MVRAALAEFASSGWMAHVMARDSWWTTPDGRLLPVRRQHAPDAFVETFIRTRQFIGDGITLYRTLLLADNFDVSTFMDRYHEFGLFWTSCLSTAMTFKPRRSYQTRHPMPVVGNRYVVEVENVSQEEIDLVATVGCRLANPVLDEVRLKPGIMKRARRVFLACDFDEDARWRSTPPVPGIAPLPEGPGFSENLRLLEEMEARLRDEGRRHMGQARST